MTGRGKFQVIHKLRINLIAVGGLYEARCSCGWQGDRRAYRDDADDDANIHADYADHLAPSIDGSTP